jgi:hypothetical protein
MASLIKTKVEIILIGVRRDGNRAFDGGFLETETKTKGSIDNIHTPPKQNATHGSRKLSMRH